MKPKLNRINILLKICGIILILLGLYYIYMNKTIIYTLKIDGNNFIKNQKLECKTNRNTKKCSITLPNESNDLIYYKYKETAYDQGDKITITDNIEMIAYEEEPIELTVTIDSEKYSCFTSIRKHNCNVTLPEIENGQAFTTNINTKDILYDGGQTININDDLTLYKTKEEIKEITLIVSINGNGLEKDNTVSCKTTNKDHSCKVQLPSLSKPTYGYNIENKENILYKTNQGITINKDLTLYVIEIKEKKTETKDDVIIKEEPKEDNDITLTYVLNIELNGASYLKTPTSCTTTDKIKRCTVKLPEVVRENGEVLGYSLTNSKDVKYKIKDELTLTSNKTIYVVSKQTYSLKLDKTTLKCDVYNTEKSCDVQLPSTGYDDKEIYINTIKYNQGSKVTLTGNTEANIKNIPKSDNNDNKENDNKTDYNSLMNPNLQIHFDDDCANLTYRKSNMDQVIKLAPYILAYTKSIKFLNVSNFYKEETNNSGHSGGVVGFQRSYEVFIKCTTETNKNEARYETLIHEIMHSEIHGVSQTTGKSHSKIASDIGASKIYTKYSDCPDSLLKERPLVPYSYTSIDEFLNDGYAYYYLGYIDPTGKYATTQKITGDTLKAFQRLDCIFKDKANNYANYNTCLTKY